MKLQALLLGLTVGSALAGCDTAPKNPQPTPAVHPSPQVASLFQNANQNTNQNANTNTNQNVVINGQVNAMPTVPSVPVANNEEFDRTVCTRMETLCGHDQNHSPEQCARDMGELRRNMGAQAVQGTADCVAQAQSCAAAGGCIAGGALRGVGGQFLQGFGTALSR